MKAAVKIKGLFYVANAFRTGSPWQCNCVGCATTNSVSYSYDKTNQRISKLGEIFSSKKINDPSGIDFFDTVDIQSTGPDHIVKELVEAMKLQWIFGFPNVPFGMSKLTHGFHHYPASMQAATAKHLLETVLHGDSVADPFVGGGTVLIEGLRAGRQVYGGDISPLALFITRGRLWLPSDILVREFQMAMMSITSQIRDVPETKFLKNWETVKQAVEKASNNYPDVALPLWFVYATAVQQGAKARHSKQRNFTLKKLFKEVSSTYLKRVLELRDEVDKSYQKRALSTPELWRCDAQKFVTPYRVSSILTSPPYPGVYDYLSYARSTKVKFGSTYLEFPIDSFVDTAIPSSRTWPTDWAESEIGAFKALKKNPFSFKDAWQCSNNAWIAQASKNLVPGGRLAIQIGDGAGINGLESTLISAEKTSSANAVDVGQLRLLAATSFKSKPSSSKRMRTEHLILFCKEG